jgi:very-short-patch-repair endonuclease
LPAGAIERARHLRKNMTAPERRLWRALRERLGDANWRKQVPLGPYFADFCSHRAKLIIELDGGQHAETGDYDAARTRFIEAQGYRVIRFWNNDVMQNLDGVLETIATSLPPLAQGAGRGEGEHVSSKGSPSPSRGFAAHPSPKGRGSEARSAGRVRVTP